jgi:glycosyltransferase involved in cell wall biosynthesis
MPAVDVVIPTRDRPAQVPGAVRSVLSQTHGDLRLWVVDAGSRRPVELPEELLADGRLTLLRSEEPLTAGAARNLGVRAGAAPVVGFLDDDDRWLPRKLERELALLERLPRRVALVASGSEMRHARGPATIEIPAPEPDLPLQLLVHPVFNPSTTIVRREALLAVGMFPTVSDRTEDWTLWLELAERFDAAVLPEPLTVRADSRIAPERLLVGLEAFHARVRPRVTRLPPRVRRRVLARQEFDRAVQVARTGARARAAWMLVHSLVLDPRAGLPAFHLLRTLTGERSWRLAADYSRAWRSRRASMGGTGSPDM